MNDRQQSSANRIEVDDFPLFEPDVKEPGAGHDDCATSPTSRAPGRQNTERRPSVKDQLMAYHSDPTLDFWVDERRKPHVSVTTIDETNETMTDHWAVDSIFFEVYLRKRYAIDHPGRYPSSRDLKEAREAYAGIALISGKIYPTRIRSGMANGAIYIDLADSLRRIIKITKESIELVTDCPIKFIRKAGMDAQVIPVKQSGALDAWRQLLGYQDVRFDNLWVLLICFTVVALHPKGPYFLAVITAEQGAGKTTLCEMLRAIIDPSKFGITSPLKDEREMIVTLENNYMLIWDNISTLSKEMCDWICRIITGISHAARTLHTNDEQHLYSFQSPMVINGISDAISSRPDAMERAIIFNLPVIREKARKTQEEISQEFEKLRPGIMYEICSGLQSLLRNVDGVKLTLPRMADAFKKATAAEEGLGFAPGAFAKAYEASKADALELTLEASPTIEIIRKLMDEVSSVEGTPTQLYKKILREADEETKWSNQLPKSASGLTTILNRTIPSLRGVGIEVEMTRTSDQRLIIIKRAPHFKPRPKSPDTVLPKYRDALTTLES